MTRDHATPLPSAVGSVRRLAGVCPGDDEILDTARGRGVGGPGAALNPTGSAAEASPDRRLPEVDGSDEPELCPPLCSRDDSGGVVEAKCGLEGCARRWAAGVFVQPHPVRDVPQFMGEVIVWPEPSPLDSWWEGVVNGHLAPPC